MNRKLRKLLSGHPKLRALILELIEEGWTVQLGRGGHFRFVDPQGQTRHSCPATPSDHRSLKNTLSQLRYAVRRWEEERDS